MTQPCILSVDHGTSGIKTALVSLDGQVLDFEKKSTPIRFLPGGGAEQDPAHWWEALLQTGRALVERNPDRAGAIAAVGVSSTFSTTVAVDKDNRAVGPAVTWMDGRGGPYIRRALEGFPNVLGYKLSNVLRWVRKTAGAPTLSGKDDCAHMLLFRHAWPDLYEKARYFLPSKDYLNLCLTGKVAASFDSMTLFWVTDTRDANNIRYDPDLCRRLGIDQSKLPPMFDSTHVLGDLLPDVANALGLGEGVKVVCGSPDHQCAGVGAGAVQDFSGHLYIGTSSWVQCPVPFKKTDPLHSIASLPFSVPGKYYAANEQDVAGGCLDFLAYTVLGWGRGKEGVYEEINQLAAQSPAGSNGVLFTPWLNGERTPVDDHHVRAGFLNLSNTTATADLCRSVMEGVAYNVRWSLMYVEKFINRPFASLRFVGGGARSALWCQILADVLDRPILQVADPMQANARGAAFLSAVGLGLMEFGDIPGRVPLAGTFTPQPKNHPVYNRLFEEFVQIYKNNRRMYKRLNSI